MLSSLLTRIERVSVARTSEEKAACARFGYDVYVREMGYEAPGTDHDTKTVWDEHDRLENAVHIYAGPPDRIKGVVRLLVWEPGRVPAHFYETYSMGLFPGIDELRTGELGRLMIRRSLRGKLVLPALVHRLSELLAWDYDVALLFSECRPGLVPHYRRLGMRPYSADLTRTPEGFMVPLVLIVSDVDYQRQVGAVTVGLATKVFGEGGRPRLPLEPFAELLNTDRQRIEHDAERVWSAIQEEITGEHPRPTLFDGLSRADQKAIARGGLVVEVDAGTCAAVEGRAETEICVVLEGRFHVIADGEPIATLGRGEVFGEMEFFRDTGVRSATVRAYGDGRLLVLRRKFLDTLKKERPEAAFTLLYNLGRILSERLAERIHPIAVSPTEDLAIRAGISPAKAVGA